MKEFLILVVAPILVGMVKSLFDHWPDDQRDNKEHKQSHFHPQRLIGYVKR